MNDARWIHGRAQMNDGGFFAGFPLATGFSSPRSRPIDLSHATSHARHVTSRHVTHGTATPNSRYGGHPLRSCITPPTSDVYIIYYIYSSCICILPFVHQTVFDIFNVSHSYCGFAIDLFFTFVPTFLHGMLPL